MAPKIILDPDFLDPIFFGPKIFWAKNFWTKIFLDTKVFCFLLIIKTFSVISNWIYNPFNNLTFAQPLLGTNFYLEIECGPAQPCLFFILNRPLINMLQSLVRFIIINHLETHNIFTIMMYKGLTSVIHGLLWYH